MNGDCFVKILVGVLVGMNGTGLLMTAARLILLGLRRLLGGPGAGMLKGRARWRQCCQWIIGCIF